MVLLHRDLPAPLAAWPWGRTLHDESFSSLPAAFGASLRWEEGSCAGLPDCWKHFWSTMCCELPTAHHSLCHVGSLAGCSCSRPASSCCLIYYTSSIIILCCLIYQEFCYLIYCLTHQELFYHYGARVPCPQFHTSSVFPIGSSSMH